MGTEEPKDLDSLKDENAALKERLAKAQFESEMYRRAAYEMLQRVAPIPELSDEEIAESIAAPRGQPLVEILEEYERELGGADGCPR